MKIKKKRKHKVLLAIAEILFILFLFCMVLFTIKLIVSIGSAIIESHNICNAMNLTGC